MAKLDKYLSLKRKVESAQQKANQAEGALNEVMRQLEREFGCNTLNDARKKLKQLEKQEADSKEKFDAAFKKFEEDWPDELD